MSQVQKPIPYRLADQIRHGIITGRYRPGSALREQGLEAEYGASRGPVREALRLLEMRGLAEHEPRRGYRVRSYSPDAIEQIYRMRALLERHSVEGLAGRGSVRHRVSPRYPGCAGCARGPRGRWR